MSDADLRWSVLDADTWEAHAGLQHVGNVRRTSAYAAGYAVQLAEGDLIGSHTSFESAQAQLDAFARWQSGAQPAL